MNLNKKIFLLLFLLCAKAVAQKSFTVQLQFPAHIEVQYLHLYYENGKKQIRVMPVVKDNQMTLSETYFAKYATIIVAYRDKKNQFQDFSNFWITDKPATIKFIAKDSTVTNPLANRILTNAYEVRDMGEQKLKNYIAKEEQEFVSFYKVNEDKIEQRDSIANRIYLELSQKTRVKSLEFITNNGDSYYSFWMFRKAFAGHPSFPSDTLIKIYNRIFPDSLKNSNEGAEIERKLRARNIKNNDQAPNFSALDITKKNIKLSNYRNKYVLLTFWASWCGPCVAEFPTLVKIRKLYQQDKLAMISVNHDNDSASFAKAIKKHNLTWTHIFRNSIIPNSYGVAGIPEVLLIAPTGKILYIRREEKDYKLELLTKLLAEKIAK